MALACLPSQDVFPTLVGVFPKYSSKSQKTRRSSPRSWGCFLFGCKLFSIFFVFPTLVGVFPLPQFTKVPPLCLPHARGGVSLIFMALDTGQPVFPTLVGVFPRTGIILIRGTGSSPRSWGCFHMTELTIYYTSSLPHARGGVSGDVKSTDTILGSSPRSWGCFTNGGGFLVIG